MASNTCPGAAKTNAHAERLDCTAQEESRDSREDTLFRDLETFNERRFEPLHWHSRHRLHYPLDPDTPGWRLARYAARLDQPSRSGMTWHQTYGARSYSQGWVRVLSETTSADERNARSITSKS